MTFRVLRPFEDSGFTVMDRIYNNDGTVITQASLSSIAYKITRLDTLATVDSGSLTIANVVFDTLQTDAKWVEEDGVTAIDSTGYNFAWFVTADKLVTGQLSYVIDVTFTPTEGATYAFCTVFNVEVKKRYN